MRPIVLLCALAALAACNSNSGEAPANESEAAQEEGETKGVDRSQKGKPAPDTTFLDAEGDEVTLAGFSGKPVLVNLWASWCAPCVKELPTLDRLAAEKADGALTVLAVSQDTGPHASVVAFLQSHNIKQLDAHQDPKMALSGALGAQVLPVSVLFDARGQEVWRYVGDLDWTGEEAAKLLAEAAGRQPG
jgi:thiol-disulfide isomerase/thioredoxin